MKRMLRSDWLPEPARWAYFAGSGFPAQVPQEKVLFLAINKSFIDQACLVKMAVLASFFLAFSQTSPSPRSIKSQRGIWPKSSHLDLTFRAFTYLLITTNQSAKPRDLTLVFLTFQSRLAVIFHILNFKCAHRLSGASIFAGISVLKCILKQTGR